MSERERQEYAVPGFMDTLLRLSSDERLTDPEQEALAAAHSVCLATPQQEPEGDGLVEVLVTAWGDDPDLQVGVPYRRMASQAAEIVRARAQPRGVRALRDNMGPTAVIDSRGRVWTKGKRSFRSAYAKEAFMSLQDLERKFGPVRRLYAETGDPK